MPVITDKQMKSKPTGKDQWFIQPFKRGAGVFVGRITAAGERIFYFRYTDSSGARPFLPIGPYGPHGHGGFTLAEAFKRASELSVLYQSGVRDLREHFERLEADRLAAEEADRRRIAEAQRERLEAEVAAARRLTVRQLFDQWQRAELSPQMLADGTRTGRKDGGQWVKQSFERRLFPHLGDTPAADVARAELMSVLDDARSEGRLRTANVLFTDMRQMFRFALEREIVVRNPLDGIRRRAVGGKEVERDRVLTDGEIEQLLDALPAARMTPRSALAVKLILATSVRVGEAMGARWDHVDLKSRRWHLPNTKNQRTHTIHLSDFAVAQFEMLAALREQLPNGDLSVWVFPATDPAKSVCIKSFGKQLADRQREPELRMSRRTKATSALALPGGRWTAHDLRRTAATILARLGFSTDVIDECLNHKLQSKVARVYIRDRREADQARAFDALGRHLQQLADAQNQEPAGSVVQMAPLEA
jgi:integrase